MNDETVQKARALDDKLKLTIERGAIWEDVQASDLHKVTERERLSSHPMMTSLEICPEAFAVFKDDCILALRKKELDLRSQLDVL